jgi:hypothetical protein
MKRDSFVFYASDYQSIKDMPDEQMGRFFRAICEYALNGIEKIDDKELLYAFKLLIDKIRRDQAKYDVICQKRSEAATRGRKKQLHAIATEYEYGSDSESISESDKIEIKKIFLFEKGCFSVNKEFDRFKAHYDKTGWVDGNGVSITNKVACAKCWTPQYKDDVEKNNALGYAKCWKSLYDLLADKEDCVLLITDVYRISSHYSKVHICISRLLYDFLKTNYDEKVDAVLKSFGQAIEWKVYDPK